MKKLKYAVIGCGAIATTKHLKTLKALEEYIKVVAVCDVDREKAENYAKIFNVKKENIYEDYKELVILKNIDVCLVLTPNSSHCEITVAALENNKHVLCEKPMAINSKEAQKMLDTAQKNKKILSIAYQNRFRQDSLTLKKMCEKEELGEIYYAKAHAVRRRAVPTWGVFMDEKKQGGGPLIDIGTHALDLTLWLMDNYEPHMVVGKAYSMLKDKSDGNIFGKWDKKKYTVEDSAMGFIVMKNGATISLESSWALNTRFNHEASCSLHGTNAGADMWNGLWINSAKFEKLLDTKINCDKGSIPFFDNEDFSPEVLEGYNFLKAVKKEEELIVKPEQALVVTKILEAIYESSKTNKAIYFEE